MSQWRRAMRQCKPSRASDALMAGPLTPEACSFHRRPETKPKMGSGLKQTQRRHEALYRPGRLE